MNTRWRSVALILGTYKDSKNSLSAPFDFGKGVILGPASLWPLNPEDVKGLSESDMHEVATRRFAFCVDYENGADVDPEWRDRETRWRFQTAGFRIHYATLALWLTRKTPFSSQLVCHQIETEEGKFAHARFRNMWSPFYCSKGHEAAHFEPGDLETAKNRFLNLYQNGPSGVVAITIGLLLKTLSDPEAVSRFTGLWTCVEALFGPDSPGETTHQVAERIALFLYGHSERAFDTYRQLKKDYGLRSKILHGLKTGDEDEKQFPSASERAEEWVRLPLAKIADSPELLADFNHAERREPFLKRLPFSADPTRSAGDEKGCSGVSEAREATRSGGEREDGQA